MDIATDGDTRSQAISASPSEDRQADTGPGPGRPLVFAAALSTIFMAAIEGTIVATAMPTIVGSLGGIDLFSWIFGAYLLTQAILIPIYGRLSDLYGRKPVLLFGIGVSCRLRALRTGVEYDFADCVSYRAGRRRRRADSGFTNRGCRHLQRRSSRQNAGLHFKHFRQRRHHRANGRRAHRNSRELESDFLDQHPARDHRCFTVGHRTQGRSEEAAPSYRLRRCGAPGVGPRSS